MIELGGWISVHRKLFNTDLWLSEKFTKGQAWLDLFGNANHQDVEIFIRGVSVKIKRGQLGWSEITMSKRWGWSRAKVRRFLDFLEKEKQIIQENRKATTIITILNYEKYQKNEKKDRPSNRPSNDTTETCVATEKTVNGRPSNDTTNRPQRNNINNYNKKDNIYTNSILSIRKNTVGPIFETEEERKKYYED